VPRWSILLLLLAVACEQPRTVTVVATIPGLDPGNRATPQFAFVALPYNRDSLVAAFEGRARRPKPATDQLDSLFAQYRAPFAAYTKLVADSRRHSDTLAALQARLDTMSRSSPAYQEAYVRWTGLRDSLALLDKEASRARASLEAARPRFIAETESLRTELRHWQDSTYQGYDSAVAALVKASHRQPVADTTGPEGAAAVRLTGHPWWIYARSWDPTDPNAEWYWNVRVDGDTVTLNATTGINRPRY